MARKTKNPPSETDVLLTNYIDQTLGNTGKIGWSSDVCCSDLRCIKLREVAGFSAVRTIFQIVGPRKILHCLLGYTTVQNKFERLT